MSDTLATYLFLVGSAFLAGAMNAIAGGGTLLTFPALTSVVSPAIANATSTLALLPGSFAGAFGFRAEIAQSRRFIARMFLPSLIGGFFGAWLVGQYPKAFAELVPWLILTASTLFLIQQPLSAWMKRHRPDREPGTVAQFGLIAFQLVVAVYGGFFGAGIGILMLTALGFMGVGDIHKMNGIKTFLAATINAGSVAIFVYDGMIEWNFAAAMAGAAIVGGYAGARGSRRLPAKAVRWLVIAIGFGLSAFYFLKPASPPSVQSTANSVLVGTEKPGNSSSAVSGSTPP